MLPAALLSVDRGQGELVPAYLGREDDVWVRRAASELFDLVGQSRDVLDEAWASRIEPALRAAGARRRAALGMRLVIERTLGLELRSPAPPEKIREVLFPIAARHTDRAAALAEAGRTLDLSPAQIEAALFADRQGARVLGAPSTAFSPRDLVLAYNLALVRGLLFRAEGVRVVLRESVRAVVRYAKLRGLLATFEAGPDGSTVMDVSGPLALFRNTLKYGRALGDVLASAAGTPGYLAIAACRLGERTMSVRIAAGDPLPPTHALPREVDSAVERAFVRDVRRSGSAWTLSRETAVLRAGTRLFFPDFTLSQGERRVLVEIAGYHTDEYIARKMEAVRALAGLPMILCVNDALDCGEQAFGAATIVRFRKRVDARAVLAVAETMFPPRPEQP